MAVKEKQKKTQLERHEEDLRFLDPTFEEYRDDENSPKSFFQLVVAYLKNAVNGIIHHLPEILIPMLIVSVALFAFNIWFWSIKNDTMWMGRGTVGKNPLSP